MGVLSWLFGQTKASAAGGAISAWMVGQPVWSDRDYAAFADEGYRRNPVVNRCVTMIASGGASVPWLLYDSRGEEIEAHPLLDLLRRPAPMASGAELFRQIYSDTLIAGNAYIEAIGPKVGPPRELWALRPDRTRVIAGPEGLPAGYEYEANGKIVRWQVNPVTGASPILHLREFHPLDDWYGLSRMEAAAYGIDRHNAASAHNKALLDNGARPSGALVFEPVKVGDAVQTAPETAIAAAERELGERHRGSANAGKPMVLGGNVRWEEMGLSPKDMDFMLGKDDAARDICNAFGVPHVLLVPGDATYNNIFEAKLQLWEDAILPLLDRVADGLNAWLCPRFGDGLRLGFDIDEISALEPRRESKRKTVITLMEKGVIDDTEAREALQYGPRDPNAVRSVDAGVLAALVAGVATFGVEPLARYMISVGLVAPGTTPDNIISAADRFLDGEEEEPVSDDPEGGSE